MFLRYEETSYLLAPIAIEEDTILETSFAVIKPLQHLLNKNFYFSIKFNSFSVFPVGEAAGIAFIEGTHLSGLINGPRKGNYLPMVPLRALRKFCHFRCEPWAPSTLNVSV